MFEANTVLETQTLASGHKCWFGRGDEAEGIGMIVEVGNMDTFGERPLVRITLAQGVDVELWGKVWLEDQIKGWVST